MKFVKYYIFLFSIFLVFGCAKDIQTTGDTEENPDPEGLYFPEIGAETWESVSLSTLGWNESAEQPLYDFLQETDTKAFLILKDGRIVIERYFSDFTVADTWYWASAGKTLTSFTVGIAQENGLLDINDATALYLGEGWTSATTEQENQITVRNQLTMTSGLKNNILLFSCISSNCLRYEADAGTVWSYHNGPYTLLQSVIENAADTPFENYFNTELRDKIGMDGIWNPNGNNNLFTSTARSMARFGILNLNNGKWEDETILGDTDYLDAMKNTSQDLNKSYGYLWWLNGKESHMGTSDQEVFMGNIIPNAPNDLYAGLGANDQKLYIVPSEGLVVVRMGEDAGESQLGLSSFDNTLWEHISALID